MVENKNIAEAGKMVTSCRRTHVVGDYLAGQVTYNLGEYPGRFSLAPTEYDRRLLGELAAHGVSLIQIHEEWNDSQRCLGADKFTAHDPDGLRAFIDLVHELGMKIILYVSTGFFEATDPDFNPAWSDSGGHLVEIYLDYALCSPASSGWRAYILPRIERILNDYKIDGLYDDLGYAPPCLAPGPNPDRLNFGEESLEYSASLENLLATVMDMVHVRGGVFKVHRGGAVPPPCKKKVYDYLWVGEGVQNIDKLRLGTRDFEPYVVPGYDMSRASVEREDDLYLQSVPYMQFPLRVDGRPLTGERAMVAGMNYRRGEACFWTKHCRSVWRRLQETPDTPPIYGWWDSSPGRVDGRSTWLRHFDLYRPMVPRGANVWIDISEGRLFESPKPDDVTVSLFAGAKTYLVAANYGRQDAELKLAGEWKDRSSSWSGRALHLPARRMRYLVDPMDGK